MKAMGNNYIKRALTLASTTLEIGEAKPLQKHITSY